MGKLTSTIGIPIKLLNEAQVSGIQVGTMRYHDMLTLYHL